MQIYLQLIKLTQMRIGVTLILNVLILLYKINQIQSKEGLLDVNNYIFNISKFSLSQCN